MLTVSAFFLFKARSSLQSVDPKPIPKMTPTVVVHQAIAASDPEGVVLPLPRTDVSIASHPAPNEARARSILSRLDAFAAALARATELTPRSFDGFVTEDFEGDPLHTDSQAVRMRDESVFVWTADAKAEGLVHRGAEGFHAALLGLASALGGVRPLRWTFRIERIEETEEGFVADVLAQAVGRSSELGVERLSRWRTQWRDDGKGSPPRLARWDVLSIEQTEARAAGGRWFVDRTAEVLGRDGGYAEQLSQGPDAWARQVQRQYGTAASRHGLAVGDANGDGRPDLYVCQRGGLPNRLFLQEPDGSVRDASISAGVDVLDESAAALFVDLDDDDDSDLVVVASAGTLLFENSGGGRFLARPRQSAPAAARGAAAADVDADGDLDLLVVGGASDGLDLLPPGSDVRASAGPSAVLLRNEREWRFVDVSSEWDLDRLAPLRTCRFADLNADGGPDLVAVEMSGRSRLLRNAGTRFVAADLPAANVSPLTVAAAAGDVDGDGRIDLILAPRVSPMGRRALASGRPPAGNLSSPSVFLSLAEGGFALQRPSLAWEGVDWANALALADVNNDGRLDAIAPAGGLSRPASVDAEPRFWSREPAAGEDAAAARARWTTSLRRGLECGDSLAGEYRTSVLLNVGDGWAPFTGPSGLEEIPAGRAVIAADWDGDGDQDLWIACHGSPELRFLRNESPARSRFLVLELVPGRGGTLAGTRIVVDPARESSEKIVRWIEGASDLGSAAERICIGVGSTERIAKLTVEWSRERRESFEGLETNRVYRIVAGERPEPIVESTRELPLAVAGTTASPSGRIWLGARPPLPKLLFTDDQNRARTPADLGPTPVLVVFWSKRSAASVRQLEALTRTSEEIRRAHLTVVAINVDPLLDGDVAGAATLGAVREFLRGLRFPFPSGLAGADTARKLAILDRHLFGLGVELPLPTSLLVDASGNLAVLYKAPATVLEIVADVGLLDADLLQRQKLGMPFPGRWFGGPIDAGFAELAERYEESGFRSEARQCLAAGIAWTRSSAANAEEVAALERVFVDNALRDGAAAEAAGRIADAETAYRDGLRVDPASARCHEALGTLLADAGRQGEAVIHLEEAVRREPRRRIALARLGAALAANGRSAEAVSRLREAMAQPGDEVAPAIALAWILAASPVDHVRNGADAIQLMKPLCDGKGSGIVACWDALAAAHAETGDFAAAVQAAERALALADAFPDLSKREGLRREIADRRDLYRRGVAYRGPPPRDGSASRANVSGIERLPADRP